MLRHMRTALTGATLMYRLVSVSTMLVVLLGSIYTAARGKNHHD